MPCILSGGKVFSFAAILALGFFLGVRHALDPDHVIAITTIVSKQSGVSRAGLIGALWGLGHTFTIFVVGTVIILFKVTIPARVGLSMELAVAAMLILLGVLNMTGVLPRLHERSSMIASVSGAVSAAGKEIPGQQPWTMDARLQQGRVAAGHWLERLLQDMGRYNALRPLIIGIVHGLAGSAAVALLVMTTIHDPWWSITYLLLFGTGTVAGMMLITTVLAMPFAFTARKFSGCNRKMALVSGLLSLGFGVFLCYQIGFVEGLFTSHPLWTPR
jgi:high-affinity nickel permease